ncbi:MAG: HAD family phosphatase [Puia sp.]|nr:HAD family phosphatase [Puia sp.]
MPKTSAFLFDLNGTMIDDMKFHLQAWYELLNEDLQAGLSWEQVRGHMYGKNSELFDRIFGPGRFAPSEVERFSLEKEKRYQQAYKPHLKLIDGLGAFLEKADQKGIRMAIGSAAIPFNIDFVLDNLSIRHYFRAIVSADDVRISKPDPETYLKAAALLKVDPSSCIVFEDAPKGVEAALNADMKCVVLTTMHETHEFSQYSNVVSFVADYTDPSLSALFL